MAPIFLENLESQNLSLEFWVGETVFFDVFSHRSHSLFVPPRVPECERLSHTPLSVVQYLETLHGVSGLGRHQVKPGVQITHRYPTSSQGPQGGTTGTQGALPGVGIAWDIRKDTARQWKQDENPTYCQKKTPSSLLRQHQIPHLQHLPSFHLGSCLTF